MFAITPTYSVKIQRYAHPYLHLLYLYEKNQIVQRVSNRLQPLALTYLKSMP